MNARERFIDAFETLLENADDIDIVALHDTLNDYRTTNARSMPRLMQFTVLREIFASCDNAADYVNERNAHANVDDITSRYIDSCNV